MIVIYDFGKKITNYKLTKQKQNVANIIKNKSCCKFCIGTDKHLTCSEFKINLCIDYHSEPVTEQSGKKHNR